MDLPTMAPGLLPDPSSDDEDAGGDGEDEDADGGSGGQVEMAYYPHVEVYFYESVKKDLNGSEEDIRLLDKKLPYIREIAHAIAQGGEGGKATRKGSKPLKGHKGRYGPKVWETRLDRARRILWEPRAIKRKG